MVLEHQLADPARKLIALPVAFAPTRDGGSCRRRRRACGLDRVGGRPEVVLGNVRHARRLTSGVGRESCRPRTGSGSAHGVAASRPGPHHGGLTPRPSAAGRNGGTGPEVVGCLGLEELQDVLGALGRPQGEEPVMFVREAAAAPDRDKPRITHFWEDHPRLLVDRTTHSLLSSPQGRMQGW